MFDAFGNVSGQCKSSALITPHCWYFMESQKAQNPLNYYILTLYTIVKNVHLSLLPMILLALQCLSPDTLSHVTMASTCPVDKKSVFSSVYVGI